MLHLSRLADLTRFTASDLRSARRVLGVDQVDFGRLLGLHRRTITRLECGRYPVPVTVALSVRFLLAISGARDFGLSKSPIVPASHPAASPVLHPGKVSTSTVQNSTPNTAAKPAKSGKGRKKKRRGY
ncbi:helix-turn-helix transcriptional regulator [Salmonella enterica]|nr:helix-turn-helix transcriptional regulator [Salmonella enterica]EJF5830801.1 helix-turn-helix transcriptional regulator [Salmonella enterica]EJF5858446.1 helix-turn-helix transcriptional regulator [Salmonella enterica]EJF5949567.1 helix-turn-helix transcriptional regulator [Salmonella enterica]EJF6160137.1 helix-turn-helix transcriptional regulator [Salmonella enterica]